MKRYTVSNLVRDRRMGRLTREKWSERDVAFSEEIRSQLYEIYNKAEIDESKTDLYKMAKPSLLCDANFYQFLETKCKAGYKNRQFRKDKRVIVNKIFEVVRDELVNRNGGVVLEGLGYLAVWVTPKKVRLLDYKTMKENKIMHETNGYFYNISLFTDIFKSGLNEVWWTMDRAITKGIKRDVFYKIAGGKKYKLYYRAVKSMYSKKYGLRLLESGF